MDLFVLDCAGESELLNKSQHYNAPSTVTSGKLLDESTDTTSKTTYKNAESEINKSSKISLPENEEDDDEDPIKDEDYYGDIPLNDIDIFQFIELPPKKPKDPMMLRIEKFCQELKCETEEMFERQILTDVAKEMKQSDTLALEGKSMEMLSLRQKKKLGKEERSKTKGAKWFGMPATEITDELKQDMEIIQMRSVLDPKHFYKKNDLKVLPKYFQVGTVQSSPLDYYNERGERKSKKKSLVDELMADAQFQRFNKRKYTEIQQEKHRSGYHKANKKMKKLKKNK